MNVLLAGQGTRDFLVEILIAGNMASTRQGASGF